MSLESYEGGCHCGAIGFTYRTALPGARWSIRACQCSFCRLHDALSTSDPEGGLDFEIREPGLLQLYRFGGRTADFLICRRCGVYVGAQMTADGRPLGIINVHSLSAPPPGLPAPAPMSYEGETPGAREGRRLARWTPVTRGPDDRPVADSVVYVWEFLVDEASRVEFERRYGPRGSWAALFGRAPGYLGTELLRDETTPGRYLTLDRWSSAAAYRAFREQFAADYAALDLECEALTRAEKALGNFTEVVP
jgi:heme-degrading monooxygenase HmoA